MPGPGLEGDADRVAVLLLAAGASGGPELQVEVVVVAVFQPVPVLQQIAAAQGTLGQIGADGLLQSGQGGGGDNRAVRIGVGEPGVHQPVSLPLRVEVRFTS